MTPLRVRTMGGAVKKCHFNNTRSSVHKKARICSDFSKPSNVSFLVDDQSNIFYVMYLEALLFKNYVYWLDRNEPAKRLEGEALCLFVNHCKL